MEVEGQEWVCPKCKKAERAMKGAASPTKKVGESPSIRMEEAAKALVPQKKQPGLPVRLQYGSKKVVSNVKIQAPTKGVVVGVKKIYEPQASQASPRKVPESMKKVVLAHTPPQTPKKFLEGAKKAEVHTDPRPEGVVDGGKKVPKTTLSTIWLLVPFSSVKFILFYI